MMAVLTRNHSRAAPRQTMRVLLIEDDPMIGEAVRHGVAGAGMAGDRARDGRQPGAVLPQERLEEAVYGRNQELSSNAFEVHGHHGRKKRGNDTIGNVRGVGYRVAAGGAR